jgi:hypothetical protein
VSIFLSGGGGERKPLVNNDIKIVLFSCALTVYKSIFLRDLKILEYTVTNLKRIKEIPSKTPVTVIVDASSLPRKILPFFGIVLPSEPPKNYRVMFNPLKTKRRLLYLKTQSVPRCKHVSTRL